jgi:hypothetical protein
MGLLTGTPYGTITQQDEIYLEGAPYIYYQENDAVTPNMVDSDGFYWGLSGTVARPVFQLACYQEVKLESDVTVNAIRCDNVGDKDVIQKLNHLQLTLTLASLLPLSSLTHILRGSAVTLSGKVEKMGIGAINNNKLYKVYLPKVYDDDTGDWVEFTIHRAKFVNAWTINMPSGDKWTVTGVTIWGFADDTMPAAQRFATVTRADPSAL